MAFFNLEADENEDKTISVGEVKRLVENKVEELSQEKQKPTTSPAGLQADSDF